MATGLVEDQPTLVYRYPQGVGFVEHHDEVSEIELERARLSGQPVLTGDVTIVGWLNDPDQYDGAN